MEVLRHPGGWCSMSLSGHAADLAARAGIGELAVSLTHEDGIAAAVVVALCRDENPATPRQSAPGHELASNGAR
jgi:phosphopantetheinyl transferase (holo-ACP synthase)